MGHDGVSKCEMMLIFCFLSWSIGYWILKRRVGGVVLGVRTQRFKSIPDSET